MPIEHINHSQPNSNNNPVVTFEKDIAKLAGLTVADCENYRDSQVIQKLYAEAKRGKEWSDQPFVNRFVSQEKSIDVIIKYRRMDHFSSFGNKYFKDRMDDPQASSLEKAACLIPRILTGTVYQLSKLGTLSGLSIFNPLAYISGFLGLIGMYTPIFQGARKEQAIRTYIEGREPRIPYFEENTDGIENFSFATRVLLRHQTLYDKNKILEGGEIEKARKIIETDADVSEKLIGRTLTNLILILDDTENTPDLSQENKNILKEEYTRLKKIEKECLILMPSLRNRGWFQKFQNDLKKINTLSSASGV